MVMTFSHSKSVLQWGIQVSQLNAGFSKLINGVYIDVDFFLTFIGIQLYWNSLFSLDGSCFSSF